MQNWHWTDVDRPLGRGRLFTRSGEFLTTAFLIFLAWALLRNQATLSALPAFTWLNDATDGRLFPWSVASFILAIIGPMAVWFDDGRLRLASLLGQGIFYLFFGLSAYQNARNGVLWGFFLIAGLWLIYRFIELGVPRLVRSFRQTRALWRRYERRG